MKFDLDISFDYETALDDASSQLHIRQLLAVVFQLVYKIHHQEAYGEYGNVKPRSRPWPVHLRCRQL